MKINEIDYKGKYFLYQDPDIPDEWGMDIITGETTKEAILADKEGIRAHKEACRYYGIPCYIGKDKELKEVFGD